MNQYIEGRPDPQAEEKALWVQAKRSVLSILRVQPARDLVECLKQPVSEENELVWEDIVQPILLATGIEVGCRALPIFAVLCTYST